MIVVPRRAWLSRRLSSSLIAWNLDFRTLASTPWSSGLPEMQSNAYRLDIAFALALRNGCTQDIGAHPSSHTSCATTLIFQQSKAPTIGGVLLETLSQNELTWLRRHTL